MQEDQIFEILELGDASEVTRGDYVRGPCDDDWEYVFDPESPGIVVPCQRHGI